MRSQVAIEPAALSARLRAGREAAHLTQTEAATRLGCSMRAVQGWEAGLHVPQPRHRRAIVEVYGDVFNPNGGEQS